MSWDIYTLQDEDPTPTCCHLVGIVWRSAPCPKKHHHHWDTDPAGTGNMAGEKHSFYLLGEDKQN